MEEVKEKLIHILEYVLEEIDVRGFLKENDDLSKIGFNSLTFVKLVVEIEMEFDVEFPDEMLDFKLLTSFANLAEYITTLINNL